MAILTWSPRRVTAVLILIALCLHALNVPAQWLLLNGADGVLAEQLVRLCTVNREGRIPTWYASGTLLLSAGLLAWIALHARRTGDRLARRWTALAVIFAVLSLDEACAIHDQLNSRLTALPGGWRLGNSPWVFVAVVALAGLWLAFRRFLAELPRDTGRLFVVSGGVYVGGAVGMEAVAAAFSRVHGTRTALHAVLASVEEALEMGGVILFVYALMRHIGEHASSWTVRLQAETGRGDPPRPDPRRSGAAAAPLITTLRVRRFACLLAMVVAGLLGAHVAVKTAQHALGHGHLLGLRPLFDMNEEANIPTWFSSTQLLVCAAVLGAAARITRRLHRRDARNWAVLAAVFVLLSLDEACSLHETVDEFRDASWSTGVLYFPWVIPGAVFAGSVALGFLPFLARLPSRTRWLILAAGAMFVTGAIGLEMLQAAVRERAGRGSMLVSLCVTVEETLEMSAVAVFLVAVLRHLATVCPAVTLGAGRTARPTVGLFASDALRAPLSVPAAASCEPAAS